MKKFFTISAGVLFLVILLLGTGAVSFYSSVSNCSSCHEMRRYYDSWKISTHSSVNCNICHYRNPSEGLFSIKGTALSRIIAHFVKKKKSPKAYISKQNCLKCHSSIRKFIKASQEFHIVNPHPVHLAAGFVCMHCHKNLVHETNVAVDRKARMEDCVNCHRKKEVSIECKTCHFGTQEHIDKIAQAGGLVVKAKKNCEVCHTSKHSARTDHKKAIKNAGGYKGTQTCLKCHVYAVKQLEASVHSRLRTKVAHVPSLAKEERGMADKAAKPATWAYMVPKKDGAMKSLGCGQCHVGGSKLPTPQMASTIDCLICHAKKYDMEKRLVVKEGDAMKWVSDQSLESAASVEKPKAEYCWRCHEDHMADTRGTPYTPERDVHAKAGLPCQSCHATVDHKIAKGVVADLMANDIPEVTIACTSCHVDYRHGVKNIDTHLSRMACQSCHIGRVSGLAVWDKTKSQKDKDGIFGDLKVRKDNIKPTFLWFNGKADKNGFPAGSRKDKKAKIYPYKIVKQISAVDPKTQKPVNGAATVFAKTGNFALAVEALAKFTGMPKAPQWIKVEGKKIEQLNHSIQRKGLDCNDCHSKNGLMNFRELGYSNKEIEKLTSPK
ncbi:MAG: NapC/NirT family cytochrome c [Actinomycetota bacterium]|nr:NapC/NirT family cytochrome c [Actinomycetota bacterium]